MEEIKKVAFFADRILPYYTGSGSAVLMYGIIQCFIDLGYDVTVIPVGATNHDSATFKKQERFLNDNNIHVRVFEDINKQKVLGHTSLIREIIFPLKPDYYYDDSSSIQAIQEYISKENISMVYGYNWACLSIITNLQGVKILISLVDLIDEFIKRKKQAYKRYRGLSRMKTYIKAQKDRKVVRYSYDYLRKVDHIVEHAYQHAQHLKKNGFTNVSYLPHPLSPPGKTFLKRNDVSETSVNILILGSLKGIASQLGFDFFFKNLLPSINTKRQNFHKTIRYRIVGHGTPTEFIINEAKKNDDITLVGFVENLEYEYANTDIMLVNIPISHGFRTRIAEAFGLGICVVAHSANAQGMPEIKDGINAAIDDNPEKLAEKLMDLVKNPVRRFELGQNAMKTFKDEISQKAALSTYKKIVESV